MRPPFSATLIASFFAITLAACEKPIENPEATAPTPPSTNDTSAAAQFAAVRAPTRDDARVYGNYTKGCLSGAKQLPTNGMHWQVLNPSRNRAWGHPALIRYIESLAASVAADGYGGLLMGDLAQPRGGPLPSDHNSHQVGLDADIWLTPLPNPRLTAESLETYDPPSMVDPETLKTNDYFGDAQYAILKHAAQSANVERIFVSPAIKQTLCNKTPAADRSWLRKVRPWRGHMAHMHVRLACPIESDDCKDQDPPPEGDGCGAELASWFQERSWARESKSKYVPEKAMRLESMPQACQSLFRARG